MDSRLRGSKIPTPSFQLGELPVGLQKVTGYREINTFFPSLGKLLNLTKNPSGQQVWLDTRWKIVGIDCSGTAGPCHLNLQENGPRAELSQRGAFLKVTHLLDPIRWIRGEYSLPDHPVVPKHKKTWKNTVQKLTDPWNQAYVESIASYALGRLREENISPHFNLFYGAFQAKADRYLFNLTEEFESYRYARWFWNGKSKSRFTIRMIDPDHPNEPLAEKMEEYIQQPDTFEEEDDDEATDDASSDDTEILDAVSGCAAVDAEITSLHSGGSSDMEEQSDAEGSAADAEGSAADSEESMPEYKIYAEIPEYPVMLIALEANEGTLDSLFESPEKVGASPGTPEWEYKWSAWLFQVIAALSVAQSIIGLTHNDLHTNNIVWSPTEDEFMYYTTRSGATFKVPTYGKVFRIIDFGRSIFQINGIYYISDDFRPENDADGQYSFKPLHKFPRNDVYPNPSFDLCRLAVSMFDAMFPDAPEPKEGGGILSEEEGLTIHESVSPLFNCMWRWMLDDEGRNVLVNPDGSERFPDFDLYKHIAASIHHAVPALQFSDPAFDRFQVNPSDVGADVKKWSLFV